MVKVTVQEGSKRRRSENKRVVYLMTKLQHVQQCSTVKSKKEKVKQLRLRA